MSASNDTVPAFTASLITGLVGPIEAGVAINAVLTGLFMVQAYAYFKRFPKDHWGLKTLVIVMILLESAHLFVNSAILWNSTIVAMLDPDTLLSFSKANIAMMLLTNWMGLVEQLFFLQRMWSISGTRLPVVVGIVLLIVNQVSGYLTIAKVFAVPNIAEYATASKVEAALVLSSDVASDLWISGSIAYYLWFERRSGAFTVTRSIYDKLIIWSFETGLCTSVVNIIVLLFYLKQGHNHIYLGVYAFSGSTYANVLLVAMNGRWILQRMSQSRVYQIGHNHKISDGPAKTNGQIPLFDLKQEPSGTKSSQLGSA